MLSKQAGQNWPQDENLTTLCCILNKNFAIKNANRWSGTDKVFNYAK